MKTLLITHIDLDGISSIIISKLFKLDITEYRLCDYKDLYDEENDKILLDIDDSYDRIFVTDIACNKKMYDYIVSKAELVGIFDHHERTSEIENEKNVYFDIGKSGTELFFDVLKSKEGSYPIWDDYVNLVSVYDLWKLEDPIRPIAEDLNRLFFKILDYGMEGYNQYSFFVDTILDKLLNNDDKEFEFDDFERNKIQQAKEKESKELQLALSNIQERVDDRGNKYLLYHGSSKISYVCSQLLKKYPSASYVLNINTFNGRGKKKVNGKISARSRDDFDVTTLRNINGHKNAGGGTFNERFLKRLWIHKEVSLGYE